MWFILGGYLKENILGEKHPDTASSCNGLAVLYTRQGEYDKAEQLYLKAIDIAKIALGENHPTVKIYRSNLDKIKHN